MIDCDDRDHRWFRGRGKRHCPVCFLVFIFRDDSPVTLHATPGTPQEN